VIGYLIRKLQTNRQKEPGETNEETSECNGSTNGPNACWLDDVDDDDYHDHDDINHTSM
jgi:hypothetical protein